MHLVQAKPEFAGTINATGWETDFEKASRFCNLTIEAGEPILIMGPAFAFVQWLDAMVPLVLPEGSRVMETGGYKGRSRQMSRAALHNHITQNLGVPSSQITREYGMCELGSQAYAHSSSNSFQFPAWARCQVVSPETMEAVAEGESGLLQVFDLSNVRSVLALKTSDLAVRRGNGFEIIGRARASEPRGCSLSLTES